MEENILRCDREFLEKWTTEFSSLWSFSDINKILTKEKVPKKHKKATSKLYDPENSFDVFLEAIEGTLNFDENESSAEIEDDSFSIMRDDRYGEPSKTRLIEKASVLLGDTEELKDVRSFQELDFCDQVHFHVIKNFRYLLRSQMCIPLMLNRRDIVLIAPDGSRKTSGYLMALASIVLSYRTASLQPQSVIIAPNFVRINYLSTMLYKLFGGALRVTVSIGESEKSKNVEEISNGCHIVITSPCCFLRLYGKQITGDHLLNITLDSASELFSIFPDEIEEIYHKTNNQHRQYMIISSKYHPNFKNFISQKLKNPVFCSISFMESALYAEVRSTLILTKKICKMTYLSDIIEKNKQSKIIVVCSSYDEVKKITVDIKVPVLTVHENSNEDYVRKIIKLWDSRKVLICSDYILYDLEISDADILINYSIPNLFSNFSHRYSVLKDKFVDKIENRETNSNCCSYILVDEGGLSKLPQLYKYAAYFKDHNMPNDYKKIATDVLEVKESMKKSKICNNILKYGFCRTFQCSERHIIMRYQDINVIPDYKYITFIVTCIHDLSHYSARIVGRSTVEVLNRNFESQFSTLPSVFVKLGMEMMEFFSNRKNRVVNVNPVVGELVMVQKEVDLLFMRAKIKSIVRGKENFIEKFIVKLIDHGEVISIPPKSVFYLPQKFREIPPQVVDIFISNVRPIDQDNTWVPSGTFALRKKFDEIKNEGLKLMSVGKVNLVLGKYVIIDDWLIHNIDNTYTHRLFSAREFIIRNKYGSCNDSHINNLLSLCVPDPLLGPSPPMEYNIDLFF